MADVRIEARSLSAGPAARVTASTRTRADGRYSLRVSPGRYLLVAVIGQFLPRCPEVTVSVSSGQRVRANIHCDSGIR